MCETAGVKLVYLPPYLPDLNPIEQSFAQLKAFIKKNKDLMSMYTSFEEFIIFALNNFNASGDSEAHFRSSGISYQS